MIILNHSVMKRPMTDCDDIFRRRRVLILGARFIWDVVRSSVEVARLALRRKPPQGAVIRAVLRSHSDVYLTITSALTTLVPGSVVVEANRFTGTLYVHILDVEMHGGLDQARRTVLDQEERVLRAFGSREELLDAGLVPGSTRRAGFLPGVERSHAQHAKAGDGKDS